jgi:hypothetical protein
MVMPGVIVWVGVGVVEGGLEGMRGGAPCESPVGEAKLLVLCCMSPEGDIKLLLLLDIS